MMKKYYASKRFTLRLNQSNYSKRFVGIPLFLLLIITVLFYFSYLSVSGLASGRLDNNIGHNKIAVGNSDNALNVNNWFFQYRQLQSNILELSKAAQASITDNNSVLLSNSCQKLNDSLLGAETIPSIPNRAAQASWEKAQTYYQAAIGICTFPNNLRLQTAPDAFLYNLRQGDKQLLNSINYILNCC